MKTILVLGAGRSSSSLINYLLVHAVSHSWRVVVGDIEIDAARRRLVPGNGEAVHFDIRDESASHETIRQADIVISLLPAQLHPLVARHCVALKKHFLSASYVSDEMRSLHREASEKGLLLLNECGLDPGIDHMSAMCVIDKIRDVGGVLTKFESFTGGLITPDTDPENPWRYKFTWNPRNVVVAGQGTARFLMDSKYKYVPYHQLFKRTTSINVSGTLYEGYPNRDSLTYLNTYGLLGIRTMIRGTLRNFGFCSSWNILVQLGCCDDTYMMESIGQMSHAQFLNSFLDGNTSLTVEEKVCAAFGLDPLGGDIQRLRWIGLFSDEIIGLSHGTPAQALEHILNKRWRLIPGDKDLIVMYHRFHYDLNGFSKVITSQLTVAGENEVETAMSRTVGLPLGIAAKLLLQGKITERGVAIPVKAELYSPVLAELSSLGITMVEKSD